MTDQIKAADKKDSSFDLVGHVRGLLERYEAGEAAGRTIFEKAISAGLFDPPIVLMNKEFCEDSKYVLSENVLRELRDLFRGKSFVESNSEPKQIDSLKELWKLLEDRNNSATMYYGVNSIEC